MSFVKHLRRVVERGLEDIRKRIVNGWHRCVHPDDLGG